MARKTRKSDIKAAANRAEAKSKGETITEPKAAIDPIITPAVTLIAKAKRGRPSTYTQETADEICDHIANGGSLRAYCMQPDTPCQSAVYRWLQQHPDFAQNYARAREDQAETHADEIIHIADTEDDVNRARLKIDARKWIAAKLKPRKYGDFKAVELSGTDGGPIQIEETGDLDQARRVALALGRALERQKMKAVDVAAS